MSGIKRRGFASLPPELRREYSRAGGRAVHEYGTGRQWTREEAISAGAKGNAIKKRDRKQVDQC